MKSVRVITNEITARSEREVTCTEVLGWSRLRTETSYNTKYICRVRDLPYFIDVSATLKKVFVVFSPGAGPFHDRNTNTLSTRNRNDNNWNYCDGNDNNIATAKTLRKMISKKQAFPRKELEQLRNAFPCIIAGIRDYADYVPLEPEIFDLIVIDEASQVSIAQAFPAILRAKKIIVLGDKRQFSNVKSTNSSRLINQQYQDELRQSFDKTFGDDPQKKERSRAFDVRVSILEFFFSYPRPSRRDRQNGG